MVSGGRTGADRCWQASAPVGHQSETLGSIIMPEIPGIPEIPSAGPEKAISGIPGISDNKKKAGPFDLNHWHHAIHAGTGDIAVRFNTATIDDLRRWARALRAVAQEMEPAK